MLVLVGHSQGANRVAETARTYKRCPMCPASTGRSFASRKAPALRNAAGVFEGTSPWDGEGEVRIEKGFLNGGLHYAYSVNVALESLPSRSPEPF